MGSLDVAVAAGSAATVVFAASTLPMLVKARRTKDMASYSLGNIVLATVGNVLYTGYVVHLPIGPIWALHAFHSVSTALMLFWYLRYALMPRWRRRPSSDAVPSGLTEPTGPSRPAGSEVRT